MQTRYQLATKLIRALNGFVAEPYTSRDGVLTIGYGRTEDVNWGDRTTVRAENKWLRSLFSSYEELINEIVHPPLNEYQFAALFSFIMSAGRGTFSRSNLVRRLNNNDQLAHEEFARFTRNGDLLPCVELVRRRRAETKLFLRGSI